MSLFLSAVSICSFSLTSPESIRNSREREERRIQLEREERREEKPSKHRGDLLRKLSDMNHNHQTWFH